MTAAVVVPCLSLVTVWILGAVGTYIDHILPALRAQRVARPRRNLDRVASWFVALLWPLDLIWQAAKALGRVWPVRILMAWLARTWVP